jgi:hypothetical protein
MTGGRRWVHRLTVVLIVVQCVWWIFVGWGIWSVRGLMLEPSSPQIAVNTRFALALLAIAGINIVAVIGFLVRAVGWGRFILAGVLVGNIVFSAWASAYEDNVGWLVLGGVPAAATLVVVFLFRSASRASA